MTVRAAVAGASGCADGELLRLPLSHPEVETGAVTAHNSPGRGLGGRYPAFLARLVKPEVVIRENSAYSS
jgi:N-acetyl-gamma-glutamyl-phosphate reductase